jgi:hypothetical protein
LLQSAQPFIDLHDLGGSRQRAFAAFRALLERSAMDHPPLDWLAAGAFPLSGPGPFTAFVLARFALDDSCAEISSLASLVAELELRLTLGAWWREPGGFIAPRFLVFDRQGTWQVLQAPAAQRLAGESGLRVNMHTRPCSESERFADQCRRLGVYGARIEPACNPAPPPGVSTPINGGSQLVAPDGRVLARAKTQGETCVVTELAA